MELFATYTFPASPAVVWRLLIDPEVVASCLPGCDRLEPLGDNRYRAELTLTVAAVSGHYTAIVAIVDQEPPRSYRMMVDGSGKAGFVKGDAMVELAGQGDSTLVTVAGHGQVGGLIARVGQRLLGSVSKMMMDRFFACLQTKLV